MASTIFSDVSGHDGVNDRVAYEASEKTHMSTKGYAFIIPNTRVWSEIGCVLQPARMLRNGTKCHAARRILTCWFDVGRITEAGYEQRRYNGSDTLCTFSMDYTVLDCVVSTIQWMFRLAI